MEDWEPIKVSKIGALKEFELARVRDSILELKSDSDKPLIRQESGFEDVDDLLQPDPNLVEIAKDKSKNPDLSGYTLSSGTAAAREAIARNYSLDDCKLNESHVILFQGEDHAFNHVIRIFCNPKDNFLIPALSFGHWKDQCGGYEVECKQYNLLPEKNWEIDLEDLASKIDKNTKFIVVSNPSGPLGSVYSKEHLQGIVAVALKHKIPLVADETYYDFAFPGTSFTSLAKVSGGVPVMQVAGISKTFCCPGWRLSWVVMYDRVGAFKQLIPAFHNLMQLALHPANYLQSLVPELFHRVNRNHLANILCEVADNHEFLYRSISETLDKFLTPVKAKGGESFVCLLKFEAFKDITSEEDFSKSFYKEENVLVIPTTGYHYKGGIVVSNVLKSKVNKDFIKRLTEFCKRHEN
jgi:tyrosine aminotransferase